MSLYNIHQGDCIPIMLELVGSEGQTFDLTGYENSRIMIQDDRRRKFFKRYVPTIDAPNAKLDVTVPGEDTREWPTGMRMMVHLQLVEPGGCMTTTHIGRVNVEAQIVTDE